MILTFKVFKEKIESGDKSQTLRPYNEKQFSKLCNTYKNKKMFQLYWHNPRNGGKLIKERPPSEMPFLVKFIEYEKFVGKKQFRQNLLSIINVSTNEKIPLLPFAKRDGFENDLEMFDWFFNEYGSQMYDMVFMAIRWVP